jgi:GTPase SAR1 family protein
MTSKTVVARPMRNLSSEYDVLAKSIIIGDSSVGKSSLLYRYTEQDWNPHYIATIGVDFKVMTFEREGKVVKLQLWDIMLVFAVNDRASFDNLSEWVQDINRFATNGVPVVLIGNKADCPVSEVAVSDEEAQALAAHLGGVYMKTSARAGTGVDEAFTEVLERCLAHRMALLKKMQQPGDNGAFNLNTRKPPIKRADEGNCKC